MLPSQIMSELNILITVKRDSTKDISITYAFQGCIMNNTILDLLCFSLLLTGLIHM